MSDERRDALILLILCLIFTFGIFAFFVIFDLSPSFFVLCDLVPFVGIFVFGNKFFNGSCD